MSVISPSPTLIFQRSKVPDLVSILEGRELTEEDMKVSTLAKEAIEQLKEKHPLTSLRKFTGAKIDSEPPNIP
jgi:hypothetical protein